MYANSPHASASMAPPSTLPAQAQPPQAHVQQPAVQHGHPQGMPPAAPGGSHGIHQGQPAAATYAPGAVPANRQVGASFVNTGAYAASGDPAIDRMIRLEAACKRFGSPI